VSEKPPPDYVDGFIDVFCLIGGFALMWYLKAEYGGPLGDWMLGLIGY
jgi:hypothetical protein